MSVSTFLVMKRKRQRPLVVATFAMTVDGKVTTKNLSPVDFTSREDKLHLFRQRALADAVLIGHTSLKRDNVRLGLPKEMQESRVKRGRSRCPLRVIVSNEGRIDHRLNIFQSDVSPIIIFSTKRMPQKYQRALEKKTTLHLSDTKNVDLAGMLQTLRNKYKVRSVACEGGPTLFRALLEQGLDRSAQSNHCALHVWWSKGPNADRPEQEIPSRERALFVERYAHHRRRVLSHLSNQARAEAPEVGVSLRRGRRTSSPSQFGQTNFICPAQFAQKVHS